MPLPFRKSTEAVKREGKRMDVQRKSEMLYVVTLYLAGKSTSVAGQNRKHQKHQ
jgi:hypothetical protein